ncbi:MAG: SCO family protein [Burkholderiaceae bacterium]|nr:SCO family protein [Burkholderiaceae bacterium]
MRALKQKVILCCALLALVAPAHASSATLTKGGQKAALGGEIALMETNGKAFRLSSQRGKVVLIYFGYTSCPDVCPTDMLQFRDVLSLLGERAKRVLPVFISLDPERDTPQHLADYAAAFSPAILPLTGSEAQLRRVAKAYGTQFHYNGRTGGSASYTVDHTANLYVVDAAGKLVRIIPYGTPTVDLVRAIAPLIR